MSWQPPISEQEAAAERGQLAPQRKAQTLVNNDDYLSKKEEEMAHYLKNLPAEAKAHLRELDREKFDIEERQIPDFPIEEAQKKPELVYDPEEDTPCIRNNQRYFLISYLKAGTSAERDWYRVWCACSSTGDVKRQVEKIREDNPYAEWWDIAVLPAGGWAPWPPNKVENQEYANKEMNEFMKKHTENTAKALRHDHERKSQLEAQEDINVRVKKERALKKKHKRWLKRQRDKAAEAGCSIEAWIEREGKDEQYRIAMGGEQAQWDGDLAKPQEYELVKVLEEQQLDDGTVQMVEKTVRRKKQTDAQRRLQHLQNSEQELLRKVSDLELRLETLALVLKRNGVDPAEVPELRWDQVQRVTEPRESQAATAVAQAKEEWKQAKRKK